MPPDAGPAEEPHIRPADHDDLLPAATAYLRAFPDTLDQLGARDMRPVAVADIMRVCLQAEPRGFFVAEVGGRPAGYTICPSRTDRVARVAFLRGHVLRVLWNWGTGRYGIGIGPALQALADKMHFLRSDHLPGAVCRARVLSIAVDPDFQGRGIGRRLLREGLSYLRREGAPDVRLEVRPHNAAAKALYESVGFVTVGQVSDTRGPWDVMVLRWEDSKE